MIAAGLLRSDDGTRPAPTRPQAAPDGREPGASPRTDRASSSPRNSRAPAERSGTGTGRVRPARHPHLRRVGSRSASPRAGSSGEAEDVEISSRPRRHRRGPGLLRAGRAVDAASWRRGAAGFLADEHSRRPGGRPEVERGWPGHAARQVTADLQRRRGDGGRALQGRLRLPDRRRVDRGASAQLEGEAEAIVASFEPA